MTRKRSRLVFFGVLTIVLSVTVGLVSGSVADAKKKKKKAANQITVSKTTPTTIPPKAGPNANDTITSIPLTVGKKAKGKVVGWDSLTATSTFSAPDNDTLSSMYAEITAPNGRTVFLNAPIVDTSVGFENTTSGPLTETPNSPFGPCRPNASHPTCPGGSGEFPEDIVAPPYNGTIGNPDLAWFGGVPAKGTWTVKVFSTSTTTAGTLNSISLSMTLKNAPV
jgi:hypothetical protein